MPKGIPNNGVNKGWYKKGQSSPKGMLGKIPWNKGVRGIKLWHNISGLKAGGWNKGTRMPKITGEKNYQWKGENVSYRSLHHWIEKWLGKPKKCEFCGKEKTTPKSIGWANKDHKYKRDLTDWIALCNSCHKIYDNKK